MADTGRPGLTYAGRTPRRSEAPVPDYVGAHRGRRPGDDDFLDHHHGDRYLPRHGEARYIPRSLPREVAWDLIIVTTYPSGS